MKSNQISHYKGARSYYKSFFHSGGNLQTHSDSDHVSVERVLFFPFLRLSLMTTRPAVIQPHREAVTCKQFPEPERAEVMEFSSGHVRHRQGRSDGAIRNVNMSLAGTVNTFQPELESCFYFTTKPLSVPSSESVQGFSCKVIQQEVWASGRRSGVC